ncbi:hypothetical protein [Chryseobacterium aureum]|uniref:hypothetical protein n=1 Tax=Chryseobacterium aureum TaxID=2497456 RepID=UPI000F86E023|nr:hypothetical protein [Chryseobacterium aureum]
MIKFSLLLLLAYVLYYAGNFIYDLFLKKDPARQDEPEVYSLSEISDVNLEPLSVNIEDVESLIMPKSFSKNEVIPQHSPENEERFSLDELRKRFESELDLDDYGKKEPENIGGSAKSNHKGWDDILQLSETMVQMVANIEGHKVYHSMV